MEMPEGAPEWFQQMAATIDGRAAQSEIENRATLAEYDEMFLTMDPRHLYLVMGMVSMAANHPDLGQQKTGEMYAILKHVRGVDPESGHPFGHQVFGGDTK